MMYDIAGVKMALNYDFTHSVESLDGYRSGFAGKSDVEAFFTGVADIAFPEGKVTRDNGFNWCVAPDGKVSIVVFNPAVFDREEIVCRFDVEKDWTAVNVRYLKRAPGIGEALTTFLSNIILRYAILKHDGILLHASSIKWNGHGIAFAAPSGIGKSTHADIWRQLYGAVILNDDSPAIKLTDNGIFIFGTPWSGTRRINTNDSARLDMIVILEQASENRITKLEKQRVLSGLLPRFLMPLYDNEMMKTAFDHIERIIGSTPVYLLECRPEKAAADLVLERL